MYSLRSQVYMRYGIADKLIDDLSIKKTEDETSVKYLYIKFKKNQRKIATNELRYR